MPHDSAPAHAELLPRLRQALGGPRYAQHWAAGEAMSIAQAVAAAAKLADGTAGTLTAAPQPAAEFTAAARRAAP